MKIKLCQLDTTVGDLFENSQKVSKIIQEETKGNISNIVVFPELIISGYPPLDLLNNPTFIAKEAEYVEELVKSTKSNPSLFIIGCLETNPGAGRNLFNSALVFKDGQVVYTYRKRLIPTYDIFDEARYFESGKQMGLFNFNGKRIGLVICEDLWYENKFYTINPAQKLFNAQADMVISINASPSVVGKYKQKIDMITKISKTYGTPIIYVNQVGGNDDIIFDGNSFVINNKGALIAHASRYEEDMLIINEESLYSLALTYPDKLLPKLYKSNAEFFYEQIVCGIKSYIKKCGFKGVVIGESGGIDSAVVTALAADALGGENVVGITMPSKYSSKGSYNDSAILCENLGTKFYAYPIKNVFNTILTDFNSVFSEESSGLMEENLQARIRGQILMSFSNRYGYLVLSTGNKSELSVGYCTVGGDMMGGLSPISDLYKMEVYDVAKYINKLHGKEMIPQVIIDKEPSAELVPNQRDIDSLPQYPILDSLLKYIIEGTLLPEKTYKMCKENTTQYPDQYEKVLKLLNKAEFKRRLAPITIKVHQISFGYGRRIPIAQKWI